MSRKWQRSFEIAVPISDVWHAFTDPDYRAKLFAPPASAPGIERAESRFELLEAVPEKRLRWIQGRTNSPYKTEFSVVFESTDAGSRIHVTRFGFGEGEDADIFSESFGLGWLHGLHDLVMALETGQLVKRHYDGCLRSAAAMSYVERDWGLEVASVPEQGFAAEAGLQRGDRLVRLAGAAVYTRADLWVLNGLLEPGSTVEVEFIRGRECLRGRGRMSAIAARMPGE